jgi:hypothetical protein
MTAPFRARRQQVGGSIVRSYSTSFVGDEDPISEGGVWVTGRRDGKDWADVVMRNGLAHGSSRRGEAAERHGHTSSAPNRDGDKEYDDPTAVLVGRWGRNQHAKANVFTKNQTPRFNQEVEIRLRSSITPHACKGYEVFWRCLKAEGAYVWIARWNGAVADWTTLARHEGAEFGVEDGDVIEAIIEGNVIRGFKNGIEVVSAVDDTFAQGAPGLGFNFACNGTYVDHGLTQYEVETWDD